MLKIKLKLKIKLELKIKLNLFKYYYVPRTILGLFTSRLWFLHQTDELRGEFGRLCQHLRTDSWTWLPTFLIDAALHQGRLPEALAKMQTSSANVIVNPIHRQRLLLKSAGIFYSLGDLRVKLYQT